MKKRKRKTNGIKIYSISTVFLFAAVILMSNLSHGKDKISVSDEPLPVTDPVSDTQMETLPSETDMAASEEDASVSEPDETDELQTDDTLAAEEPARPEPLPDPADADNVWAMFLVNAKNPVSSEYSDSLETEKVYESWREYYMDSRAAEHMKQMLEDAAKDDIQLIVMSAYRSIEYQQTNFDNSVKDRMENRGMTYDEAYADTLREVQLPGFSEHNAGLAADIMSDEYSDMSDDGFKNTSAYAWLSEHAADYGFILRYPEGKESITGIGYEPWHYRFVGKYYARDIKEKGICLEEYFEQMNWLDENGIAISHSVSG